MLTEEVPSAGYDRLKRTVWEITVCGTNCWTRDWMENWHSIDMRSQGEKTQIYRICPTRRPFPNPVGIPWFTAAPAFDLNDIPLLARKEISAKGNIGRFPSPSSLESPLHEMIHPITVESRIAFSHRSENVTVEWTFISNMLLKIWLQYNEYRLPVRQDSFRIWPRTVVEVRFSL
jgi:hypothetical protein